ncbi:MAG: hypothetical protein WA973_11110 [Mesorhizobium sp.]
MRIPGMLALAATLTAGAASASSFAVVEGSSPPATPSIVTLGTAGQQTPSILSMGEPLPAVANEKVAAIPSQRRHGPAPAPLVIRGGVAGSAFAPARLAEKTAEPAAIAQPNEQASASQGDTAGQSAAPDAPPAYLPPNGYGNHRPL